MIMTDNEIIKALNEADGINEVGIYCADCEGEYIAIVKVSDVVDLINRLKAEIERLEEILGGTSKVLTVTCAGVRVKAFKEFAERFENELTKIEEIYFDEEHENFISANKVIALLDYLVEEMERENDR